jgi:hypothetical protein
MANRQLEDTKMAPGATVLRPDGEAAEIVHAIARASHEIAPPESHGYPDYAAWAKLVIARSEKLSAIELHWLLSDNSAHLDAYEKAYPGAGVGLEDRINTRLAKLEAEPEMRPDHEASSALDRGAVTPSRPLRSNSS